MEHLELYNKAKNALAEAHTVDELSTILKQTDILKYAAQVANDNEMIMQATEIKLRAERRFGEVSKGLEKAPKGWEAKNLKLNSVEVKSKSKTLAAVGVSPQMANTYEKVADVPEEIFEKALSDFKEEGEMSRAKLLKTVKTKEKEPPPYVESNKKFELIIKHVSNTHKELGLFITMMKKLNNEGQDMVAEKHRMQHFKDLLTVLKEDINILLNGNPEG